MNKRTLKERLEKLEVDRSKWKGIRAGYFLEEKKGGFYGRILVSSGNASIYSGTINGVHRFTSYPDSVVIFEFFVGESVYSLTKSLSTEESCLHYLDGFYSFPTRAELRKNGFEEERGGKGTVFDINYIRKYGV